MTDTGKLTKTNGVSTFSYSSKKKSSNLKSPCGLSFNFLARMARGSSAPSPNISPFADPENQAWATFADSFNGTLNRGNNIDDGGPNMYIQGPYDFTHYGTEDYSSGAEATLVKCSGQRDTSCSAGNGQYSVTPGHFYSFGVELGAVGCASL